MYETLQDMATGTVGEEHVSIIREPGSSYLGHLMQSSALRKTTSKVIYKCLCYILFQCICKSAVVSAVACVQFSIDIYDVTTPPSFASVLYQSSPVTAVHQIT